MEGMAIIISIAVIVGGIIILYFQNKKENADKSNEVKFKNSEFYEEKIKKLSETDIADVYIISTQEIYKGNLSAKEIENIEIEIEAARKIFEERIKNIEEREIFNTYCTIENMKSTKSIVDNTKTIKNILLFFIWASIIGAIIFAIALNSN
jgi:hypothetical protein